MRALLVVNPKATATTARVRDVLIRALGSDLKIDVVETQRRGHAIALGAQARSDGDVDVVLVLGGDGTVNEVVNGLLADGPGPDAPALAIVPGGSTNVFARALKLPTDPVEATGFLLDRLEGGHSRRVGLGRADGRYFTFTAGLGLDGAAVQAVERARRHGRRSTPGLYVRATVGEYFRAMDTRHPALTLEIPGREPVEGVYLGIVSNTAPWTYFGSRPIHMSPEASFDTGLDLVAMRRASLWAMLRGVEGMLAPAATGPRGRGVVHEHDLARFTLRGAEPLAFEVDGDYLGERTSVEFVAVPQALRVLA